jgi:Tfp pilus assembly protein PilN
MRPVNLIPEEDRRGDRAPLRTGSFTYVLLGALTLGLIGMVVLALTSKQITDREDEKAGLQATLTSVTQRAENLRAFADFRAAQERRSATVTSLAESRFDWERVMRELSLVIPSNVWLLKLTGTASPKVQIEDAAENPARDGVPGPALELVGCTTSQDDVAGFLAALEDIDGVTRVAVTSSGLPDGDTQTSSDTTGEEISSDCRTREWIYKFEMVVAFDAVPAPATATEAPGVPPAAGAAPATAAPAATPAATTAPVGG